MSSARNQLVRACGMISRHSARTQCTRSFSAISRLNASDSNSSTSPTESARGSRSNLTSLSDLFPTTSREKLGALNTIFPDLAQKSLYDADERAMTKLYHFHVYSTKHNTHITLTRPNREPMLSLSCGNMGSRKAQRGSFESAYTLAAYVLGQISGRGWLGEMRDVELIFRGFGDGRNAVTKAIMGTEGRFFRDRICRVSDSTRLRQGGTRPPKPRRLG